MDVEYSSDDSLAWTNASSESQSSTDVITNMKLNNCESGSEHKKEFQDNLLYSSEGKKRKKESKKRKHDEELCENEDYRPPKKKMIKTEPESDSRSEVGANIARSDSFANLRIKQENSSEPDETKTKKKKKHKKNKEETMNESEFLNGTEDNQNILDMTPTENNIKKKKKKKKVKHSDSEEGREENKIRNSYTIENIEDNENELSNEIVNDKRKRVMSSTVLENELNTVVDESIINNISVIPSKFSRKTMRISDRLKFEDDENINKLENEYVSDNDILFSKEVKMFLKSNPALSPIKSFVPFNTDDDDILVIKCPTEININDFKDVNLVLDGKSKIKVAGQTYNGTVDENDCKLPIVTYSRKKVFLKNLSVLKTITFRKRIPVPHLQDDTILIHNHTNFIPLPDTKCRHPLFGTDYKKAIKISKSVGERLSENDLQCKVGEQEIYKNKRKKHKKEKNRNEKELDVEASISVKEEHENPIKKRKRKHKIKEESDVKPAKRIKFEQDPSAWDSEKAIEENLFNF